MKYLISSIAVCFLICCSGKTLSPEKQKIVGTYEGNLSNNHYKFIFDEDGKVELFQNQKKEDEDGSWSITNGEVQVKDPTGDILVFETGSNGNLTMIALIENGNRKNAPSESRVVLTKIK